MKFRVSFKTPDALFYALQDVPENQQEEAKEIAEKFMQWEECITVEFDTTAGTATVVPQ